MTKVIVANRSATRDPFSRRHNPPLIRDLRKFLEKLANDSSLLKQDRVRERLDALDALDRSLAAYQPKRLTNDFETEVLNQANALRTKFEAVNSGLYQAIRSEIARGAAPRTLRRSIQASSRQRESAFGFGYDYRDEVASGFLQLREPRKPRRRPLPETVFYQPSPVRHILYLVAAGEFSKTDVFVDLGSGLGHVVLMVSILKKVRSIGIEIEPAYVSVARQCARKLNLDRVTFIRGDARSADFSGGTVFYLYTPFIGGVLTDVLEKLRNEASRRRIRICALGPCTRILAMQSWLKPAALPDPERVTFFRTLL